MSLSGGYIVFKPSLDKWTLPNKTRQSSSTKKYSSLEASILNRLNVKPDRVQKDGHVPSMNKWWLGERSAFIGNKLHVYLQAYVEENKMKYHKLMELSSDLMHVVLLRTKSLVHMKKSQLSKASVDAHAMYRDAIQHAYIRFQNIFEYSNIDSEEASYILDKSVISAIHDYAQEETEFLEIITQYGIEHFLDFVDEEVIDLLSRLNDLDL